MRISLEGRQKRSPATANSLEAATTANCRVVYSIRTGCTTGAIRKNHTWEKIFWYFHSSVRSDGSWVRAVPVSCTYQTDICWWSILKSILKLLHPSRFKSETDWLRAEFNADQLTRNLSHEVSHFWLHKSSKSSRDIGLFGRYWICQSTWPLLDYKLELRWEILFATKNTIYRARNLSPCSIPPGVLQKRALHSVMLIIYYPDRTKVLLVGDLVSA